MYVFVCILLLFFLIFPAVMSCKTAVMAALGIIVILVIGIPVCIGVAEGILRHVRNTNDSIQLLSGPARLLYTINDGFNYHKVWVTNKDDLLALIKSYWLWKKGRKQARLWEHKN